MFGLNPAQEVFIVIVSSLGILYGYWTIHKAQLRKKAKSNYWKDKKQGNKTKR